MGRQEEKSEYSSVPTAYVVVQGLPAACDESTLHTFCHPFHCVSHRFLSTHTPSCVIHFDDHTWSQQFHAVHSDKLRISGDTPFTWNSLTATTPTPTALSRLGERDRPSHDRKEQSGGRVGDRGWSEEEGEVDVEVEETPAARSARLDREFDLSSLASLCGDEADGSTGGVRPP